MKFSKNEQKIIDEMMKMIMDKAMLEFRRIHMPPIYRTDSFKIENRIIRPGAVLKTKSGKIRKFRLRKIK